eukprot:351828-Chlamydomonas_euryale.AAC.5
MCERRTWHQGREGAAAGVGRAGVDGVGRLILGIRGGRGPLQVWCELVCMVWGGSYLASAEREGAAAGVERAGVDGVGRLVRGIC